jgi:hypothetical protein
MSKRIRVINCEAFGKIFDNLTPNSEHDVIRESGTKGKGRAKIPSGVYVMGVGEEVKLLVGEYEFI